MAGGSMVGHLFFHTGGEQIVSRGQLKYSLYRTMEKAEGQLHQFSVVHQVKSVSCGRKKDKVRKSITQNMRELRFCLNVLIVFLSLFQKIPALIYSTIFKVNLIIPALFHSFSISGWIRVGFCLSPLCRCQHNAWFFLILYQFQTLFSGVSSEHTSRLSTLEIIIPRSLTGREKHPLFSHEVCYSIWFSFVLILAGFQNTVLYYTHLQWMLSRDFCNEMSFTLSSDS